jgi:oligopeptide/dipeptide ABC transporter ATP-binding protein
MYAGEILEVGDVEDIFERPIHPYTRGLLKATPRPDEVADRMTTIEGLPPNLISPPPGCAFAPRCDQAQQDCARRHEMTTYEENRQVSCWCALKTRP